MVAYRWFYPKPKRQKVQAAGNETVFLPLSLLHLFFSYPASLFTLTVPDGSVSYLTLSSIFQTLI